MRDLDQRLEELEARFSFLDEALAESVRILAEQGALLEALREALLELRETALQAPGPEGPEPPPPHY